MLIETDSGIFVIRIIIRNGIQRIDFLIKAKLKINKYVDKSFIKISTNERYHITTSLIAECKINWIM